MTHTPFLKQVANHYNQSVDNLSDYCFVFPNRRSGKFFAQYLALGAPKTGFLPNITTIADFIADITEETPASPIESIFNLYEAYRTVSGNEDYEFDRFVFWGNIILKDFSDVDLYMVDAEQIFTNTAQLREIATDYLSDDVKKEIERFFNVHFDPSSEENDRFWKHYHESIGESKEKDSVKEKYYHMWEILYPIYMEFNKRMEEKGLSYTGKMSKDAAIKIKLTAPEDFEFKKYVFVGFNVLSTSELAIFDGLKKKKMAEFCWDYASPAFADKANKGTHFLSIYTKKFPNAFDIESIDEFPPSIHVIGVPSDVGQAKYAFKVVDQFIESGDIPHPENAVNTAIVMPDENLFSHLLNSISPNITKANATLGYPLRNSDMATLMRIVSRMHRQATRNAGDGQYYFYRDFVKDTLSHPLIKSMFGKESTQIISLIDNENLFNVPESLFEGTPVEELFTTIKDLQNKDEVIGYLERIKKFCCKINQLYIQNNTPSENDDKTVVGLQSAFLQQYIEAIDDIKLTIKDYGVPMCEGTIFYLIDRLTSLYTVPFQGEPLNGLQMMGVLETRNLDFENLIMLSMNERMFPRKFFSSSFIPTNLRKLFVMSSIEEQESMTAYYFYRLISRAKNVYLIYDSSDCGIGSGEYSRFIAQLDKVYGCKIQYQQLAMEAKPSNSLNINVEKTGRIKKCIDAYSIEGSHRFLSASSIKEFIKCPLKFYLHHIEGLNEENDESEFMDAATFGSIVHDTLQQLYYPKEKVEEGKHFFLKKSEIENFKKNHLETYLIRNVNRLYLHKKEDELDTPLTGEPTIVMEALRLYALNVIDYDLSLLENDNDFFEVYECELSHEITLKLGQCHPFNFTYKADRIDRINGRGPLRIIDYKTGRDETNINNIADLINPNYTKNVLAILQLFIYCNAYAQEHPEETGAIQPIIYKLRDMDETGVKFKKHTIEDFRDKIEGKKNEVHDVNQEFIDAMTLLMENFFSDEQKFSQCEESSHSACQYCKFVEFCRR